MSNYDLIRTFVPTYSQTTVRKGSTIHKRRYGKETLSPQETHGGSRA